MKMKTFASTILALSLLTGGTATLLAQSPEVQGEVKKIDESAGKITIKHDHIPNLEMDAMTMVFRVKEPGMLQSVKVGDKIKFTADRVNGAITVTGITK
jgi:Cu(I)/Ag(I) efflux system periplasmic protein CusF